MISVAEVVADADLQAPQPFQIQRSIQGLFVAGGFQSTTMTIEDFGPVQPSTDLDAQMVPEADRLGQLMTFWATQPLYTTRGKAPLITTHGEMLQGTLPGTIFTFASAPPAEQVSVFHNGLLLVEGIDYTIVGATITLTAQAQVDDILYGTWPVTQMVGLAAADILVYPPNGERYRILAMKHFPGSGFYRAIGTRMNAA